MIPGKAWLYVGLAGQGMFGVRFLVQWIVSESKRKSVIPVAFWYASIAGGFLLLAYAIHKRETIFIVGEAFSLMVFIRNLVLVKRFGTSGL